jgi:hypothetical protein
VNLRNLHRKIDRLTPPPPPCPVCCRRPALVRDPALAGPCPACGQPGPALVCEAVVQDQADVGRVREAAEAAGLLVIGPTGYDPAQGK